MCRMYGHLAAAPVAAAGMLVDEPHSLVAQSRLDWRAESHGDGWGIGYFDGDRLRFVRRPEAACDDPEFTAAARRVISHAVIGHVRQASVGDRSMANTHPFAYGRWIFAHNGTITGFDSLMAGLVDETDPDLRQQIGGTTDSEHAFFWILSRLRAAGEPAEGPCRDPHTAAQVVAQAVRTLEERSAATRPDTPARLNFLLTDGAVLIASRWRHSLYWTLRRGPCAAPPTAGTAAAGTAITGTAMPGDATAAAIPVATRSAAPAGFLPRGVAVASESIGEAPWAEVPEASVLLVDRDLIVHWVRI